VNRERWEQDAPRDAVLVEADAISARFDGAVLRVSENDPPSNDPKVLALRALREALLDPQDVNHVGELLRIAQKR
jgi:hypothetical protein